jgi:hypothetical protein
MARDRTEVAGDKRQVARGRPALRRRRTDFAPRGSDLVVRHPHPTGDDSDLA